MNVEAAQCPSGSDDSNQMHNRTGPWSVHITPRGFSQSVKLEIHLECEYHLRITLQTLHSQKAKHENNGPFIAPLKAGLCNIEESSMTHWSNSTHPSLFLWLGQCDCTRNRQENSDDCSGHGALVCGQCECYEAYAGQRCQRTTDFFMSSNEDSCRSGPNAAVCSNRGICVEGVCECETRENPEEIYSGSYCECNNFECPYWNNRYNMS